MKQQRGPVLSRVEGFTLIETIIYLALFTIIIGGGMVATYQVIQSTAASTNHVAMEEEANFLLRKISWAMVGGRTLSIAGGGTLLTITTYDGTSLAFSYDTIGQTIKLNSTVLNSSSVKVTALSFTAAGTNGVTTAFTLTTVQNGKPVTEDFSATQYTHQ